jgi:hypothetical protein
MFEDDAERTPTSLRGRLAEVYYPALLDDSDEALATRLGERATTYNPLFGAASGLRAIQPHLKALSEWLLDKQASYAQKAEIVGIDRDVTEGVLTMRVDGANVELPVAVVMQRLKNREVDLRSYHATLPLHRWQAPRTKREPGEGYVLSKDVAEHLAALRLGDADALVASFESHGQLRDGAGAVHTREGDKLRQFYIATLQSERGANDWVPIVLATADNGRACAVEYVTEKLRGEETSPKEGLIVFERGDSGLFRTVRIYDELGLRDV